MKMVQTLLLVLLCSLCLAGCGDSYQWNQKLTVVVLTPDGEKSGSSTTHVTVVDDSEAWYFPHEARGTKTRLHGEAVVVDLGGGDVLFALLKGKTPKGRAKQMAWSLLHQKTGKDDVAYLGNRLAQGGLKFDVGPGHYPLFVTFDDLSRPATVKQVDPNDLAATFGPGYTLKSLTLEITDEPVTTGKVEKVLGWLKNLKGGYLHGGFTSRGAPLGLHAGDFKVGK